MSAMNPSFLRVPWPTCPPARCTTKLGFVFCPPPPASAPPTKLFRPPCLRGQPLPEHDVTQPPINTLSLSFPCTVSHPWTLPKTFFSLSFSFFPSLLLLKTHHGRSIRFPLLTSWPERPRCSSAHPTLNPKHWSYPEPSPSPDSPPKRRHGIPQTLRTQRCHRPWHLQVQGSRRLIRGSAPWYRTHCQRRPHAHFVRSPHLWVSHKVHAYYLSLS